MDNVRILIENTIKDLNLDKKEISLRLGRNHAYIQQYLSKGSPKVLGEVERKKLSKILNLDERLLMPAELLATSDGDPIELPSMRETPNAVVTNEKLARGHKIPLYGAAVGGDYGEFELNGSLLDTIFAPPSLSGIPGAYGVKIVGDSMWPRYEDNETVYVNPKRRPVKGDYVIVEIWNDDHETKLAYIKRLIRWTQSELVLEQFNPAKELRFEGASVATVHYVLRSGE